MRSKIIESLILIALDSITLLLAFALAYFFRLGTFSHGVFPFLPYLTMSLLLIPVWIGLLAFSGRYSLKEQSFIQYGKQIILASLASSFLFPVLFYFQNEQFFSRGIILLIFILGGTFLFLNSYTIRYFSKWKSKHNIGISRMLVIGVGRSAQQIISHLLYSDSRHKPVAILSPYGSKYKEISGIPVLGKLDALEKVFTSHRIDEVFLSEAVEHAENLASFCRNKGIVLRTSLETLGVKHHKIDAETLGKTVFLTLQQSPLFGWGQFFKRMFDLFLSGLGIFIFSPYIAWNWKYKQKRIFRNGPSSHDCFTGWVFEKNGAEYGKNILLLWNVFIKDMSLVGPQVLTESEYSQYFSDTSLLASSRFILRPGIFGPCNPIQVPNSIESLRTETSYIQQWSFWRDLQILFFYGPQNRTLH